MNLSPFQSPPGKPQTPIVSLARIRYAIVSGLGMEKTENTNSEIRDNLACVHCGYNLRGLQTDQQCPECGGSIVDSLRGHLLKFADPDWLNKLRFGASLKLWNLAISFLIGFGTVLLPAAGFGQPPVALVSLLGGVLGLWASFAITTQEPRISLQEDTVTLRKMVRVCAAGGFAGGIVQLVNPPAGFSVVVGILAAVLALSGIVAMVGELVYFGRFALRIPDEKLARSTRKLLWAYSIVLFGGVVIGALAVFRGALPIPTGGTAAPPSGMGLFGGVPMMAGMCFLAILGLVCFLWYVRLLTKYKDAFKQAAADARTLTAATTIGGAIDPAGDKV